MEFKVPDKLEIITSFVDSLGDGKENNFIATQAFMHYLKMGATGIIMAIPPQYIDQITEYLSTLDKTAEGTHVFKDQWQAISDKVKKAQESAAAGNKEEAQKYFGEAQTEFEQFFKKVKNKNETDFFRMSIKEKEREREIASGELNEGEKLIYNLASSTIKKADEAYSKHEFTRSKILYKLSGEILTLSSQCRDEKSCAAALKKLVAGKWNTANANKAEVKATEQMKKAARLMGSAEKYMASGDYIKSAEFFIESAVLLEQAIQDALAQSQQPD